MVAFGMLGRYFGRRFLTAVAVAFLTCVALIAVVDFFELTRRVGDRADSSVAQIGYLVLLRLPSFTEQMLPFATLIGAMSAFLALSRRLEFVVARASGISAWQFIGSAVAVALLIGIAATTIYNPLSAAMKESADRIESELLAARAAAIGWNQEKAPGTIWVRQRSNDGQAIINAQTSSNQGRVRGGSPRYRSSRRRKVRGCLRRISCRPRSRPSRSAAPSPTRPHFRSGNCLLRSNWCARRGYPRRGMKSNINSCSRVRSCSQRWSSSQPRSAFVGRMVTIGVLSGFLLYVASQLSEQLGEGGFLHPVVAGWLPVVCAGMIGCSILLHQEDG
jgi:lipopolysaccharide export system permease protein